MIMDWSEGIRSILDTRESQPTASLHSTHIAHSHALLPSPPSSPRLWTSHCGSQAGSGQLETGLGAGIGPKSPDSGRLPCPCPSSPSAHSHSRPSPPVPLNPSRVRGGYTHPLLLSSSHPCSSSSLHFHLPSHPSSPNSPFPPPSLPVLNFG